MSRRGAAIGVALVALVVIGVAIGVTRKSPTHLAAKAIAAVNHPAPDFVLPDLSGRKVHLSDEQGHVVLVNFWATWCIPCRQEMPMIDRLAREARRSLVTLTIDEQEPASDVRTFVRDHDLSLSPLLDADGHVGLAYSVIAQPVTFWLDRSGTIRAIHYGAMSRHYAQSELTKLPG